MYLKLKFMAQSLNQPERATQGNHLPVPALPKKGRVGCTHRNPQ